MGLAIFFEIMANVAEALRKNKDTASTKSNRRAQGRVNQHACRGERDWWRGRGDTGQGPQGLCPE